jgi:outer membrane protein TolC
VVTFGGTNFNNAFLQQPVNVDRIDPSERTLLGTNTFLNGTAVGNLLGGITLGNICTDPSVLSLTPQNFFQSFRDIARSGAIDFSGAQGLQQFLNSVTQIEPESRLFQLQVSDAVAARARLQLQRLGPVPVDEINRTAGLTLSVSKPFRNGWNLSGDASLQSQERNYRDKPLDPGFGGFAQPPQFLSQLSFTVNVPLGRGFGYTIVGAPERSARLVLAAERENLRQNAAAEVFRTTLAYVNFMAARETLQAYLESQARQQRIVQLTDQAVQIGDVPRVETARAQAQASRIASSISAARTALTGARLSLAEAMGIDPGRIEEAPVPSDSFATVLPPVPPADALITRALTLRHDVRARAQRLAASETLAAGAALGLRRRYDFNVNIGVSNIYDSPVYHFLPDEQSTIIPAPTTTQLQAIRYYSWSGFNHVIAGRYTPFGIAKFRIEFPFKNSAARGRLQQAQATLTSSRVNAADLTRSIRDNIVDLTGQIRQAAAAIERWQAAVRADEEAVRGAFQRFEIREVKLIDTLLTEEAATTDTLQLIGQRQQYFATLARLKFETGELLTFAPEGQSISDYKFDSSFLVAR